MELISCSICSIVDAILVASNQSNFMKVVTSNLKRWNHLPTGASIDKMKFSDLDFCLVPSNNQISA